jgi:putative oxidoreductase
MLKQIILGTSQSKSISVDFSLLLLRVFSGLAMALAHGWGKLPPSPGFVESTGKLGFPQPEVFAWAAGITEFGGGILLVLGLFTRPSAFFLSFTMVVAAFMRHADDPFATKEKALLFLVIYIALLFTGSGRFGLDAFLFKKKR